MKTEREKNQDQVNLEKKQYILEDLVRRCKPRVGNNNDITLYGKLDKYRRLMARKTKPSVSDTVRLVDAIIYLAQFNVNEQQ